MSDFGHDPSTSGMVGHRQGSKWDNRDVARPRPTSPDLAPGEVTSPVNDLASSPPPLQGGEVRGRGTPPQTTHTHTKIMGEVNMTHQPWLAARIATAARKAKPGTCRTCGAPVLIGLDSDTLALTATVNAHPATPADELRAHTAGRGTYTLTAGELDRRSHAAIRRTPTPHQPIHIDHTCERKP